MKTIISQVLEVEISDANARAIVRDYLCQEFDWHVDYRIIQDKVMRIFPHSKTASGQIISAQPQYVRMPSENDMLVDKVFEVLNLQ